MNKLIGHAVLCLVLTACDRQPPAATAPAAPAPATGERDSELRDAVRQPLDKAAAAARQLEDVPNKEALDNAGADR